MQQSNIQTSYSWRKTRTIKGINGIEARQHSEVIMSKRILTSSKASYKQKQYNFGVVFRQYAARYCTSDETMYAVIVPSDARFEEL